MLDVLKSTIRPLMLDERVLEAAYTLYSSAPQSTLPAIDLKMLSEETGKSPLHCRNTIVEANGVGRFPDCALHS